jgi:hypothetical protein
MSGEQQRFASSNIIRSFLDIAPQQVILFFMMGFRENQDKDVRFAQAAQKEFFIF